jgi:hypothetical protein
VAFCTFGTCSGSHFSASALVSTFKFSQHGLQVLIKHHNIHHLMKIFNCVSTRFYIISRSGERKNIDLRAGAQSCRHPSRGSCRKAFRRMTPVSQHFFSSRIRRKRESRASLISPVAYRLPVIALTASIAVRNVHCHWCIGWVAQ